MNVDKPVIVLDTSCLLGIHRLAGVLGRPFEKLVLPPSVANIAWPAGPDVCRFAIEHELSAGKKSIDVGAITRGENETVRVVQQEFEEVKKFISKLKAAKLLDAPSFEDWPTPAGERTRFLKFYNPFLLDYVSELQNGMETIRVAGADFEVIGACWYHGYSFETYRPEISTFLCHKYGADNFEESEETIEVCGDLRDEGLDRYIQTIAKGSGDIKRQLGPTRAEIVKRYLKVVGKSLLQGVLSWGGTAWSIINGIEEEEEKIESEREQDQQAREKTRDELRRTILRTAAVNSTNSERVSIMEGLAKFVDKPRPALDM